MKKIFYSIILVFFYFNSISQKVTFKGILYEHNSKTNTGKIKTLQNAQIIIPYTVPTTTDNSGKFKTETDAYKLGQSTKLTVRKAGYEVVNIKDLEKVIAGNLDDVKIYLAPQNLLYEAQMKYYNLAKNSVESSYDKKLNVLLSDLQKSKKLYQNSKEDFNKYEKDFLEKSQKLDNERDNALKSAQDLSKSIAEINLDFANTLYKRAISFFIKGEIDSCLNLLNSNQFNVQLYKTIKDIDKLKESIYEEGNNLKTLIDKDIFKAQIYQSKMQQDSVENICNRVSKLTFKYYDFLGLDDFLQFNKKIISLDPNNSFKFINDEYFNDFISLIKIKAGKGSNQEAEAIRLYGFYEMNKGQNQISYDLFEKSLNIVRYNNSKDSTLILLNLIDHGLRYDSKGYEYFLKLVVNKFNYNVSIEFEKNPLYFEHILNNPVDILYAVKTLTHMYDVFGWTSRSLAISTNFIIYALHPNNIRKFSKEDINYFKIKLIKGKNIRTKNLNNNDFNDLISIGESINKSSISYLNYMSDLSEICLSEILDFKDKSFSNDEIIKRNIEKELPNLEKNEYFKNLNIYDNFKYELTKTSLKFISIKFKSNNIDPKYFINELISLTVFWRDHQETDKGLYLNNIKVIYKLLREIIGCDVYEKIPIPFLNIASTLADKSVYNGLSFYKEILIDLYNCNLQNKDSLNLINHIEKYIQYSTKNIIPSSIDTVNMRYGIFLGPVLNNKSDYFKNFYSRNYNNIEDFFYGSDFAIKNGNYGIVKRFNKHNFTEPDNLNYDSLWRVYNNNLDNDRNSKNDSLWEFINENNIPKLLSHTTKIDSITLESYNKSLFNINKFKGTMALASWTQMGNAGMFFNDYLYTKLLYTYDTSGNYTKNINRLNEFIQFGYPRFFVGYSKYSGITIDYLSLNYFYGIKAAYINSDTLNLNYFIDSFNETYNMLSDKNKINFLNAFLWSTYNEAIIINNENKVDLNFNNHFINDLYLKFKVLLTNKTLIENKTGDKEDKIFEFDENRIYLNCLLTLSGASHLDKFDFELLKTLEIEYPNEARFYRNEALYWFRKNNIKMATDALITSKKMGFINSDFFLKKVELSKYHNLITNIFNNN